MRILRALFRTLVWYLPFILAIVMVYWIFFYLPLYEGV